MVKDIVVQGKITRNPDIVPGLKTAVRRRKLHPVAKTIYSKPFVLPKAFRSRSFEEPGVLSRFHTGDTLKRQAKERVYRKLASVPMLTVKDWQKPLIPENIEVLPQQPQVFPELAGFDEIDIGEANATAAPNASANRGFWGNLQSLLTTGTSIYTQIMQQKYQKQTEEARARAELARLEAMKLQAQAQTQPQVITVPGTSSKFPVSYVLVLGLGVLAALLLKKKKGGN
jgi:hypothetical protein